MNRKLLVALAFFSAVTAPLPCAAERPATDDVTHTETGVASYYSRRFEGRRTANGETFRNEQLTAAHPSLPFGTVVLVTSLKAGHSVIVRITDRLPSKRAIIDLTRKAAAQLNMLSAGRAPVTIKVLEWGRGQARALRRVAQQAPITLGSAATDLIAVAAGEEAR